jgi:hypothetical protein
MGTPQGRTLALSAPRRLICDLLHFAQKIPSIPVQRMMNVADLAALRDRAARRISWCAIFTKAYARAAAAVPELRRTYLPFPRPRLYEHPFSVASVAVERLYRDEHAVFFAHLRAPEDQPLRDLDEHLRRFKEDPIESFGLYRRALLVSRFPRWLRRGLWWVGLNTSGPKRARRMGTFGVSSYAGLGAESLHPLSPLTTTLNYGVIRADGRVPVRVVYDHRALDGSTVARALARMEQVLRQDILTELRRETNLAA